MLKKITVVNAGKPRPGPDKFLLRLHLDTARAGTIRFETLPIYSKPEADARAFLLSMRHGLDRDELPTHPVVEPGPQPGEETQQ